MSGGEQSAPRPLARIAGNRPLIRLLAVQAPADFADWIDFVAIGAILAYFWEAGPVAFAWLAVALGLPYVLVGPFAGALVDRSDLRLVMIASNFGRAVATLALILAANVPVLLVLVALRSSIDAFFSPARQAAVQSLVVEEDRTAANGASFAINQASKIAGPAIGGAMLIALNPDAIFAISGAVSLLAAALAIGLPRSMRAASAGGESVVADIRAAIVEVRGRPKLVFAVVLMSAGFFAMFLYDTLIPLLTLEFGHPESVFGIAIAAVGGAGIVGAVLLGLRSGAASPLGPIATGAIVSGAVAVALGVAAIAGWGISALVYVGLFAVLGLATSLLVVPFRTIIQDETTPASIAKVTALTEAVNTAVLLAAPFIGAAIAELYSVGAAFALGGALFVAIGIAVLFRLFRR